MPFLVQRPGTCDTTQPFLKWLGGKRELVNSQIRPLYAKAAPIGRLVEPFCGSAAVALGLGAEHALLADANPYLINLYQAIKAGTFQLAPYANTEDDYYAARDRFNDLIRAGVNTVETASEAAAIFYYLNRHCFNGLIRFNNKGIFNAAYGKYKKAWYEDPSPYQGAFAGWTFASASYEQTLSQVRSSDFVYLDPPYDATFTKYSKGGFDWDDQLTLAEIAASLNCPVVISNNGTSRIRKLYKRLGFTLKTVQVRRSISCDGNRDDATEILAYKNI